MKNIAMAALAAGVLCVGTASADEFVWDWSGGMGNANGGNISGLSASFNTNTNRFTWQVTFEPLAGDSEASTDGFWLAVSPGPNPKGHAGELALLYFDASGSEAKLTAYAYNGVNGASSYRDGNGDGVSGDEDRILSSVADDSFVNELSSVDNVDGTRTFTVDIDASAIQGHDPAGGPDGEWTGVEFGSRIGVWFHALVGLDAEYGADGYLEDWDFDTQGWLDTANRGTSVVPGAGGLALLLGMGGMRRRRRD